MKKLISTRKFIKSIDNYMKTIMSVKISEEQKQKLMKIFYQRKFKQSKNQYNLLKIKRVNK